MRWMSTATVAWLVLFTAACGAPAERHAQTPEVATATAGRAVTATAQDASTPDRRVGAVFLGGETPSLQRIGAPLARGRPHPHGRSLHVG